MKRNVKRGALMPALLLALLLTLLSVTIGAGRSAAQSPDAPNAPLATGVLINEILAHTDEPQVDSVEFYNPTNAPINMVGWWFTDDTAVPDRMVLPATAVVPARGYFVLELPAPPAGPFALSEMGEGVLLTAIGSNGVSSGYTDSVDFGASPNGVSLGRVVTSDGVAHFPLQTLLTLGGPNAAPRIGPVVIAEIMYNPIAGRPEYIEIVNTGDVAVALYDPDRPANHWQIAGIQNFVIPTTTLAPGASLFVAGVTAAQFRTAYNLADDVAVVGPFAGRLDNAGDRIALLAPEPPNQGTGEVPYVVADEVKYLPTLPWPEPPNGQGPALTRRQLQGFGQEPQNWDDGTLPLEEGPFVAISRKSVLPAGGGARRIVWSTPFEWRLTGFTLWRAPAGSPRSAAVAVGGAVQAHNSRHLAAEYTIIDALADPNSAYTYWLEAQSASAETLPLATLSAAPLEVVLLPVVKK
jgi:hypothetical protein